MLEGPGKNKKEAEKGDLGRGWVLEAGAAGRGHPWEPPQVACGRNTLQTPLESLGGPHILYRALGRGVNNPRAPYRSSGGDTPPRPL